MNCPNCGSALSAVLLPAGSAMPIAPTSYLNRFGLTDREAEVCDLVVAGGTNDSIAANLGISEQTVKTHLGRAFQKIGVTRRVGLALVAFGREAV